ncbi:MAG TPA: hypothetical protein DD417_00660 [Elusimicrobia bacterium]|nr:hypothetical protein [Elusimicrobiota bacterium]
MTARMGPRLQKEAETQLLADLAAYGVDAAGLSIDWSEACREGHCTKALDGELEDLSEVSVIDSEGDPVAEGWMDFVHGGGDNPLFVFWSSLSLFKNNEWVRVKDEPHIPSHVWGRLPDATRRLCTEEGEYDARWAEDPTVLAWKRGQNPA